MNQVNQALHLLEADPYDQALARTVHPPDWTNPDPKGRYNLVVVGGGTAGLVSAAGAAGLGARVALVERALMGGDCLNAGCVPSKALIRSARAAASVRDAGAFGVEVPSGTRVNFAAVMERVRKLRSQISPNDGAERFKKLGVDVYLGNAAFTGPDTVEVGGQRLRFKKAVIATGARAASLPLPGLAETGCLTNETVFTLTQLPKRLAVIGAGPIGCELAQAFARFGSKVSLLEVMPQILIREDKDAAKIVEAALVRDGVEIVTDCKITNVRRDGGEKVFSFEVAGQKRELRVDEILLGVGRAPNVEGLGLEAAGVIYDKTGVKVDDYLETSNRNIYAAGDICSVYKFTHAADAMARIVLQNALFRGRARASALTIPWCTYTDPEIAHVGLYEKDAQEKGYRTRTFVHELRDTDRAILDGEVEGFAKVLVAQGSDEILGATIVSPHAGETISEVTLAMVGKLGLGTLAKTIHPYPTQAESLKRVADAYSRTRLTPFVKKLFSRWFAWGR
jgi:pyruvate/2-oxoglutarate dehydrogenase complex dihydrolipoamide dehydrogenase (E3) component